jgi:hypothetical protein
VTADLEVRLGLQVHAAEQIRSEKQDEVVSELSASGNCRKPTPAAKS